MENRKVKVMMLLKAILEFYSSRFSLQRRASVEEAMQCSPYVVSEGKIKTYLQYVFDCCIRQIESRLNARIMLH